ncbi:MAG: ATP-binding protein [Deltaproteobacteria bacterium]|nr:ATP-binding protein [Deltaproteobacteria bacterium]
MTKAAKGKSPFYVGQPVPVKFFIGRQNELKKIMRAIGQVEHGKQQAVFLTGEHGIGKSSLAGYMRRYAEKYHHILGIHLLLGSAKTIEDVAAKTVDALVKTRHPNQAVTDAIREFLSKYTIADAALGINIDVETLRADSAGLANGFLPLLHELTSRLHGHGIRGVMLIMDEINWIASNQQFPHFLKALIDENGLSSAPLPILLMLCGVEEKRQEMIGNYQPIERVFNIIDLKPFNDDDMKAFFTKTFNAAGMKVKDEALSGLCHYSAGLPRIMHVIGDNVFWVDNDNVIDGEDVTKGIF